jgi:glycosyltransferase involved in cell wall biosynthesis
LINFHHSLRTNLVRILYFSRNYTTHDRRFLSFLAKFDHEVGFLQFEANDDQLEDRPLPPQVRHLHWIGSENPLTLINGLRFLTGLRKILLDFRPDLIHAGPIQRSAFLVAMTGFHPLVSMSWGYDLLIDAHQGPLWKWATTFTLKRSDALVVDCTTVRNLANEFGMKNDRIVSFPWGANIRKFSPAAEKWKVDIRERLGWGKDHFVLLSTRSWSEIYGVEDLALAFVQIARKHPEVRLLMLGNGPLAPKLREILLGGGVKDMVHFPGEVTQEKLPDYYRAADLYVSTSHSDGTSISMLESIASGTPVLLSDIPGNQEWITKPGEVGWLFRDGDVDSLTEAIHYAIDNRNLLCRMGLAARKFSESRGNWEMNAPHLFEAYSIAQN